MSNRINNLIKSVPDLRYDCSEGNFLTNRKALYDFAELIIRECAEVALREEHDPYECILSHFEIGYEQPN